MSVGKQQVYQNVLTSILQQEQGPEGFLNAIFSFLNVNTDFFIERNENVKFGLPAGEAKSMVDRVFTKHKNNSSNGAAAHLLKKKPISEDKVQKKVVKKVPVEEKMLTTQEEFQSNSDSYNGAMREGYTWSQSYDEVDVKINLPDYIKKSHQVNVVIKAKHLLVEIDNEDLGSPRKKIIDCELKHEVNPFEDSATSWYIEAGKSLNVSFICSNSYSNI